MLVTLIQRYDKKSFHFKNERLTEILQAVRCHILCLYALMPYTNLLNLSWIIKCLFLRNMEPLNKLGKISQLAFYVNLHRAVIGPSATLTGR